MKTFFSISILFSALLLTSCSSTRLVSSWHDPNAKTAIAGMNKVLVLCLVKDETTRRVAEDELVKRNPQAFAVSYNDLPMGTLKSNPNALNDVLTKGNYNGILMMRLVSKDQETTYVPGTSPSYYGGYRGYYGYAAPMYYDPGYYRTDQYYSVETSLYSLSPDKLVWTGLTETANPGSIQTTINEIADEVAAQMKKDKLVGSSEKK